jgi:hypothetical protein
MARNDWYTIEEEATQYVCYKIDPDDRTPQTDRGPQNLPNRYTIGKEGGNAAMCDCFAGAKFCRHKQMIVRFKETGRIGQKWLHNFDRNKWLPPLNQET